MGDRQRADEEAASRRRKTLGVASYRATRVGRQVVLIAVGETPTPNYRVWLRAAVEPDKRHVHELWWLPPVGVQAQVRTPFSVHASFAVPPEVQKIVVRDAEGLHEVKIEPSAGLARPPEAKALVYLHYANQFDLKYEHKDISFTQANIAGDPLLTVGDRFFIGDQIRLLMTPIGEMVTVTMSEVEGDSLLVSLVLPPTRVSGYETVAVEALVLETVSRGAIAGPPIGAEVLIEKVSTIEGHATYIVS